MDRIFEIIELALCMAGYKIIEGDNDSIIACRGGVDFEIRIDELVP